ncbi:MAG: helix-turn-helix transcriptional regulator [Eggerthellaceae bacterium]|nr:helix-turn-helix transcriptional regulator [Eggerthellaceae bacterium]
MSQADDQGVYPNTLAIILLIGGFACFIAWPLATLLDAPSTTGTLAFFTLDPAKPFALLGALATLLCSMRAPVAHWVSEKSASAAFLVVMALVVAALPVVEFISLSGLAVPLAASILLWVGNGMAFALLLLLWGNAWSSYVACFGKKDLWVNLIASIVLAALICVGLAFVRFDVSVLIAGGIPLFSLLLNRALVSQTNRIAAPGSMSVDAVVDMPGKHAAYVVAMSSYCSFMLFLGAKVVGAEQTLVTSSATVLAMCAVLATIAALKGGLPRFLLMERATFPIAISGTIASPFIENPIVATVVMVLSVLGVSAFMVSHWELMVKWSQRFRLQTIHHYAYGTYTLTGGFLLGVILSQAIGLVAAPFEISVTVVCLAFMVCIVTLSAFSPFDSESVFNSFEHGVVKFQNSEGVWRSVMDEVSQEYGLTPREAEVLTFLSKGRSVKYISTSLSISEHTTKTHVYHIYKKLDINGLQELIDLIDSLLQQAKKDKT